MQILLLVRTVMMLLLSMHLHFNHSRNLLISDFLRTLHVSFTKEYSTWVTISIHMRSVSLLFRKSKILCLEITYFRNCSDFLVSFPIYVSGNLLNGLSGKKIICREIERGHWLGNPVIVPKTKFWRLMTFSMSQTLLRLESRLYISTGSLLLMPSGVLGDFPDGRSPASSWWLIPCYTFTRCRMRPGAAAPEEVTKCWTQSTGGPPAVVVVLSWRVSQICFRYTNEEPTNEPTNQMLRIL